MYIRYIFSGSDVPKNDIRAFLFCAGLSAYNGIEPKQDNLIEKRNIHHFELSNKILLGSYGEKEE